MPLDEARCRVPRFLHVGLGRAFDIAVFDCYVECCALVCLSIGSENSSFFNVDDFLQGVIGALTALIIILNRKIQRRLALVCFGFDDPVPLVVAECLDCLCISAESCDV